MTFIFIYCWYCCWTFNTRSIDTPIQKVTMWCDPQINRELNSWTWTHHHQSELLELIYNCVGKYDSQFTVTSRQRKRSKSSQLTLISFTSATKSPSLVTARTVKTQHARFDSSCGSFFCVVLFLVKCKLSNESKNVQKSNRIKSVLLRLCCKKHSG